MEKSEIPAVTEQGTVQGLAKLYAFLANNGSLNDQTLCSQATAKSLQTVSFEEKESVKQKRGQWALVFMINSPVLFSFGPSKKSFGHMGM